MDHLAHIDEESLERYALDNASPEQSDVIEQHLIICEHCRSRLRELDNFISGLRAASGLAPSGNSKKGDKPLVMRLTIQ